MLSVVLVAVGWGATRMLSVDVCVIFDALKLVGFLSVAKCACKFEHLSSVFDGRLLLTH